MVWWSGLSHHVVYPYPILEHWFEFLCFQSHSQLMWHLAKVMGQGVESLPSLWDKWMEFLLPGGQAGTVLAVAGI